MKNSKKLIHISNDLSDFEKLFNSSLYHTARNPIGYIDSLTIDYFKAIR